MIEDQDRWRNEFIYRHVKLEVSMGHRDISLSLYYKVIGHSRSGAQETDGSCKYSASSYQPLVS